MKTVLIVDDEPHVVRVLKLTLERAGYRVLTAPDGRAGLAMALAEPPHALVTDIQMPHMNGRELVQALVRELPERGFPILVMTSMTEREERSWVRAIPQVEFLEKPLSPRHLVVCLARLLAPQPTAAGDAHA
jgi:CheY-like chemotaxis protein